MQINKHRKIQNKEQVYKVEAIERILSNSKDILKYIASTPNKKDAAEVRSKLVSLFDDEQCSASHARNIVSSYINDYFGNDVIENSLQEEIRLYEKRSKAKKNLDLFGPNNLSVNKYPLNSSENALLIQPCKEHNRIQYKRRKISKKYFYNFMDNVLNTTGFKNTTELRELFTNNRPGPGFCSKTFQRCLKQYINDDANNKNLKLKIEKSKSTKIGFYTIPNT